MGNLMRSYSLALVLCILCACAQVRSLPGGEKDQTPPAVLFASPGNLSTRFNDNGFEITFDEYVQLNNISQELIISPPLMKPPSVKIKKKSVVVSWKEELIPNTTYQFNFGDGVTDVNESNISRDLLYVFSTGDHIDSLGIDGFVHDVQIDQPCKSYKVLLFENDTSVFSKKPAPVYFARTRDDGSFKLSYLKEGSYHMYALDDLNSNYGWNDGEAFAFFDSLVQPFAGDSGVYRMQSSTPFPKTLIIENYLSDSTGLLKFSAHPHFAEIKIISLSGIDIQTTRVGDTLYSNLKGLPTDRLEKIVVQSGGDFNDTLQLPFYKQAQEHVFKLRVVNGQKIKASDQITVLSDCLMTTNDPARISLMRDSIPVPINILSADTGRVIKLSSPLVPGGNYHCVFLPGVLKNISGGTNDTLRYDFQVYKPEELGTIEFDLGSGRKKSDVYFELLNKNNELVFMTDDLSSGLIRINGLPAMEYTARFVEDYNRNGRYDPVIPREKSQPEITHVYPGKINVRSNWELKLTWKIEMRDQNWK